MKTFFFYLFLFFFLVCGFIVWIFYPTKTLLPQSKDDKPNVYMFLSPSCGTCIQFKRKFYPKIISEYKDKVHFINIDSDSMKGHDLLVQTVHKCYLSVSPVPLMVINNTCLQNTNEVLFSYKSKINTMIFKHRMRKNIRKLFSKNQKS